MEENLIGAMLLSREAIKTALTIVTETDFQGVWWLQAFGVMKELYERGDAIDGSIVGAEC
jgi:replicative DNA helicase